MSLDRRCQLCGTTLKKGRLVLDHYFWLKSATGDEIEQFSENCLWCAVLKELYFKCLTEAERSVRGVLDWGSDHFEPIWKADGGSVDLEIFATDNSDPIDGIPIKAVVPKNNSSTASFTQALRWLKYCDALHSCSSDESSQVIPKRLLDIGMNKSRFAQRVKLIETTGAERAYACLSHCWGAETSACITTKKNYAENLKGIPWEGLTQTFQDAVIFARKLQVRYLWIDSLCIVQDDKLDWASESGKMSDIYQGGYITIAATSSGDSKGGLIYDSPTELYNAHTRTIQSSDDALVDGKVVFRRKLPHFSDLHPSKTARKDEAMQTYPLLGRAWAFQERLLSPRILHFSRHELIWECFEASGCQCLQGSEPFYPEDSSIGALKFHPKREHAVPLKISSMSPSVSEDDAMALLTRWHEIVVQYSRLRLTVPTDKLPALSGLAQHFQSNATPAYKYVAGMWRPQLWHELVWMSSNNALRERPLTWRAPSWSWASVDGGICYPWTTSDPRDVIPSIPNRPPLINVLDISVIPLTPDPYGQLASATLQILGPLVDGTVTYSSNRTPDFKITVKGGLVAKFYVDYALHQRNEEYHVPSGAKVKCLRVGQYFPQDHVLSLVLKQVEPDIAVYRRIGLAVEICTLEDIKAMRAAVNQSSHFSPHAQGTTDIVTII